MLSLENIDDILAWLVKGYSISRCTMRQSGLNTTTLVAGKLMGLTESDWWYILRGPDPEEEPGLLTKLQFIQLYELAYIRRVEQLKSELCTQYVLNSVCHIGEYSRYTHKVQSLKESIEKPYKTDTQIDI